MASASLLALLIVAWVSGMLALRAGMAEAEEISRQEHLKAMRRFQ